MDEFICVKCGRLQFIAAFDFLLYHRCAGVQKWSFFFRIIGMNSILIYLSGHFIDWEYSTNALLGWLGQLVGEPYNMVVMAICYVMVEWGFLYFMYKRKSFSGYSLCLRHCYMCQNSLCDRSALGSVSVCAIHLLQALSNTGYFSILFCQAEILLHHTAEEFPCFCRTVMSQKKKPVLIACFKIGKSCFHLLNSSSACAGFPVNSSAVA